LYILKELLKALSITCCSVYHYYYRQHCVQRKAPVFKLLRGRFCVFLPRRCDTLHRWGCEIWHGERDQRVPSSFGPLLRTKFHPHWCNDIDRTQKLKFSLRFDQNVKYKRPAGAYPLCDFYSICRVCIQFEDALSVKILFDLPKGLWSYGCFKLTGSCCPQIFSAS